MMFRRFRSRMDNRQATVATAHAIARVVYRMLKYKVEYDQIDVTEYEKKYEEQGYVTNDFLHKPNVI